MCLFFKRCCFGRAKAFSEKAFAIYFPSKIMKEHVKDLKYAEYLYAENTFLKVTNHGKNVIRKVNIKNSFKNFFLSLTSSYFFLTIFWCLLREVHN